MNDEKLPPVDALVNALNGIESAKAKRAAVESFADEYAHFVPNLAEIAESIRERLAVDAQPKRKPRKPYRRAWGFHEMPLWEDLHSIPVRVLGEVS